jgi:SAM-dependent methyltransferase
MICARSGRACSGGQELAGVAGPVDQTVTDYVLELDDAAVRRFIVTARLAERAERDQWALAGIKLGATVADIGCGPGAVTVLLGQRVEPGGSVVGIDSDQAALAAARRLASDSGTGNVVFRKRDAASTGLAPGTFDVVMLRHVLGHNGRRQQAIVNHLGSLLREGGSVYLADTDLTALRMFPPEPTLLDMWQRYSEFQASRGNDVSAGLRLADLLERAGLKVTHFRRRYDLLREKGFRGPAWEAREAMSADGFAGPEDLERWREAFSRLEEAEEPPGLFLPVFTATGRYERGL